VQKKGGTAEPLTLNGSFESDMASIEALSVMVRRVADRFSFLQILTRTSLLSDSATVRGGDAAYHAYPFIQANTGKR